MEAIALLLTELPTTPLVNINHEYYSANLFHPITRYLLLVPYRISNAQALNLGIRTPIVLAPMAGASGGALASEVSLAGGFGFLAPGPGIAVPNRSQNYANGGFIFSLRRAGEL